MKSLQGDRSTSYLWYEHSLAHLADCTLNQFVVDEWDDGFKVARDEVARQFGELTKHNRQDIAKLKIQSWAKQKPGTLIKSKRLWSVIIMSAV